MSNAIDAAATETRKPDGPDLYTGLAFEMNEIELGMKVLNRHVRDLRKRFDEKATVGVVLMATEVAKVSGQISTLSAHMSKIAAKHTKRRTRV